MLSDLRQNNLVSGQPWSTATQRGLCANKGCGKVAGKQCVRCGLRYCSVECQKADWKKRHKTHCEPKDISNTENVFQQLKQRLQDYKDGKTSVDRYYSIAMQMDFQHRFPLHENSSNKAAYFTLYEPKSRRAVTVLEDHEGGPEHCIFRGDGVYVANRGVPTLPLSKSQKQLRLAAGLPVREATELIPLPKDFQQINTASQYKRVVRNMRRALHRELQTALLYIEIATHPGIGWGYGNPVFLNLNNMLAYEDYVQKSFGGGDGFPFNLCCSILYPEFNPPMRTGKLEDAQKVLGCCEHEFIERCVAPPHVSDHWASIFDKKLMQQEVKDEDEAYELKLGVSQDSHMMRMILFNFKTDPCQHSAFTVADACPESLDVCPASQSAFVPGADGWVVVSQFVR